MKPVEDMINTSGYDQGGRKIENISIVFDFASKFQSIIDFDFINDFDFAPFFENGFDFVK